jgi:hypothetical protein
LKILEFLKWLKDSPKIDACFYINNPWDIFDLTISECSWDGEKFDYSSEFEKSLNSGICHINFHNMINSKSTSDRIIKYNKKTDCLYPKEEILFFCSRYSIEETKFLSFCFFQSNYFRFL